MSNKSRNHVKGKYRQVNNIEQIENQEAMPSKGFKESYLSEEYENYILYYFGNIEDAFKRVDYAFVYSVGPLFTIATVKKGMIDSLLEDVNEIYYAEKSYPYTLSGLEKVNSLSEYKFINEENPTLNGEGVIVGIISTGIEYLNKRFTTESNNSRIIAIWDQTIEGGKGPLVPLSYGSEFSKEDIDNAIKAKALGNDPYSIVKHKDEVGYGTAVAGIVGGRKLYLEDPFISVAPKCEFAIVKLKEAKKSTLEVNGVEETGVPVYESTDIRFAIVYLAQLQIKENKPMVIYLSVGTNVGGHDGASPMELFIDYYANRRGLEIVTDTGSQGDTETHTSGVIQKTGDEKTIEINVDVNQKNIYVAIWFTRPDKVSIGIIPPTGSPIKRIPPVLLNGEEILIDIGDSRASIQFYLSTTNGIQYVTILIRNVNSGIWKINVIGDYIVEGSYDAWLYQRELLSQGTKFMNPDPFVTLTIPSTSNTTSTTSYFDSETGIAVAKSGKGYTRDGRIEPEVSSPGTNILTTWLNEENISVSGASAAAAIITGAIALILQWGIVDGNDKNLYSPKIKTYLIRGVVREPNIEYPNKEYGYGRLSIDKLIKVLQSRSYDNKWKEKYENKTKRELWKNLYIKVPNEIYEKIRKQNDI